jgi:hypothetical protein
MKGALLNRASANRTLDPQARKASSPKGVPFKTGQFLRGSVIRLRADGFALVKAEARIFEAHTSIPLEKGKSYGFLVKTTSPRVELKVVDKDGVDTSALCRRWVSGQSERRIFGQLLQELAASPSAKNLKTLLPLLLYQGPGQKDAAGLFRNLLSSGIFWEKKVFRHLLLQQKNQTVTPLAEDDLKGFLLSLKGDREAMRSVGGHGVEQGAIDRLLALLENHQTLNLEALREGWGWYWFIPGTGREGLLSGELFGRKAEKGDLHELHMVLLYSTLGEIHVDGFLQEKNVSLSLSVTDQTVGSFLEKQKDLLKKQIEKSGLTVTRVFCRTVSQEKIWSPFSGKKEMQALMDLEI